MRSEHRKGRRRAPADRDGVHIDLHTAPPDERQIENAYEEDIDPVPIEWLLLHRKELSERGMSGPLLDRLYPLPSCVPRHLN